MTHHLQKARLTAANPPTANTPDPGTPLQAHASHAAAVAGQSRAWALTPLASHGHASMQAPPPPPQPQQSQGHPPMPAGRSGGR
ncbi:hypothetical protein Zm00014a_028979 [Zea mays]|uniref:Uncharacterized protein n=1 Tax=Zea mays TaxID=4577 RepID=A0A3L6GBE6_MAIZE|nr:hypothetical protein Zm00014a_028979 [Zea mays]